jgi:predicted phosphodiesterase
MKISVCSDIHLEFGPITLDNVDNADVLVLSGDICVAKDVRQKDDYGTTKETINYTIHTFFQHACAQFPHVIYLAGNHEHYHGDFATTYNNLRQHLGYLTNLHIMEKDVFVLDGVGFIAGTLWTDMNKEDPITMNRIRGYMNDYRTISNSNHPPIIFKGGDINEAGQWVEDPWGTHTRPAKFTPEDSVVDHKAMLDYIHQTIDGQWDAKPSKFVVCGHHSPSKQSTKPQYEDNVMVNGAYSSDLTEFILDHPQIKLWTHGHTHHEFDYLIGNTRIVCNPRGYDGYEDQADHFTLKTVEV